MRPYVLLVIIGILIAGLAALAVRSTVPAPTTDSAAAPAIKTARILVAQDTIPAGSFVRAETHLSWGEWPEDQIKSPPYIAQAEGVELDSFSGAVARRTIFAGEPITQSSVVKPGEGGFMSAVLGAGKRAVSIPVDPTTGNAGFIFPGDMVDLILTHTTERGGNTSYASETFVEKVRVLAVDQMLDNPENKAMLAKTITLEVTPREAEAVNVAMEMGKISLSLRSLAADEPVIATTPTYPVPPSDVAADEIPEGVSESGIIPVVTDVEYFYPGSDHAQPAPRAFTRDSDISRLLGANGDGSIAKVRIIRGKDSSEVEFQLMDERP